MRFLISPRTLVLIDRSGFRMHHAPIGAHFEPTMLKGTKIYLLKLDKFEETPEEMTRAVTESVVERTVDQALRFHAERTEQLFKRVLRANNASEAAQMVATEIEVTEERINERSNV